VASDAARLARDHYCNSSDQLLEIASQAANARRLLGIAGLAKDVPFCFERDAYSFVGEMGADGWVTV
jgi:phosphosulfolactate phosphohydrolase-like enzyme